MAAGRPRTSLESIEVLWKVGTLTGLGDRQLLERFVSQDEPMRETAFAALVRRHGPMVLNVCRSVLRDAQASEDAFQATFLVLARKAHRLRRPDRLGPWLYGVATRTARKASSIRRIQAQHQRQLPAAGLEDLIGDEGRHELRSIHREEVELLYQELDRLPEKYRLPVILCHFEGLTHEEAARRLRCPVGTLSARLIRARELLRSRLTRRGVAPTLGLPAVMAAKEASAVVVPAALIESTTGVALGSIMGRVVSAGATSTTATALARRVLWSLGLARLRDALALFMAMVVGVAATWRLALVNEPDVQFVTLLARLGFSMPSPRPPLTQPPASEGRGGPRPSPGYLWALMPGPFDWPWGQTSQSKFGKGPYNYWRRELDIPRSGRRGFLNVRCDVVEVEDGSLLMTLVHPAGLEGEPVIDYRPVAFDDRGRRYLPRWEGGAPRAREFGARMPIDHFRLSPDIVAAGEVVSIGVERMTSTTLRLAQQDTAAPQRRALPRPRPAVADRVGFEASLGCSWQITPSPMRRGDWSRFLRNDICCDVVRSRHGSLFIYLACRGIARPPSPYRPVLFDAQGRRYGHWSGSWSRRSTGRAYPNSTEIVELVYYCQSIGCENGVVVIDRPAQEIASVGIERTKTGSFVYIENGK